MTNPPFNDSKQDPQSADPGLGVLLSTVFAEWNAQRVLFLVLRNYEGLPATTSNDVDVLLEARQFTLAERAMIAAAARCGYRLHNRVEFATVSFFFHHPGSLRQIQIDLFTHTRWHCFDLMPTREVLARRQLRPLFATPHPLDEAVISILGRLIYGGAVREKYREGIAKAFGNDPAGATELLSAAFGKTLGPIVVNYAAARDWEKVEMLVANLRRALVVRRIVHEPVDTAAALFSDAARFLRRLLRPAGIIVAVLGADGSGKSTISARCVELLRNTFNPGKMLQVHWKPVVFLSNRRKGTGKPTVDPHGKPARGRLLSLVYLSFHWIEYAIGSHLFFRKATFKNGLVLLDRYYYDFYIDQRRYRMRVPDWVLRSLFSVVKKPDLVFLLDAPAEVLQTRKQEVSLAETARQVEAYRTMIKQLSQGRMVDSTQPIDAAAQLMASQILQYLSDRQRRRSLEITD